MATIMVVDDAVFMRQMIIKVLVAEGHEIICEASSAKDAVEKYKKLRPDLVTMDIVMPMMEELDGIGAVREIIKFDPNARILIVSVMAQQSLIVDAIRAGAKDFVTKPVQPARLVMAVRTALTSKPPQSAQSP